MGLVTSLRKPKALIGILVVIVVFQSLFLLAVGPNLILSSSSNENDLFRETIRMSSTTTIQQPAPVVIKDENNLLPRVLAMVFPQFHEDELNNRLWRKGFTDWDSLRKAPSKNRLGFAIPRPSELGFYNYTDIDPRKKQGQLAKKYGIDGFVYHHYWFYDEDHPGPNFHRPLVAMLRDGHPDVPFALHWCASKWTQTWTSNVRSDFKFKEPGVLQKQYFPLDDKEGNITQHYNFLKQFFRHKNYIKVDGKPLFMMYQKKPGSFPVLEKLKQLAIQDGFPGLYTTVGLTKPHDDLLDIGDVSQYNPRPNRASLTFKKYTFDKYVSYPNPTEWNKDRVLKVPEWCNDAGRNDNKTNNQKKHPRQPDIAGIISSFDNTPRRNYNESNIWSSDSPDIVVETFRQNLHASIYYEACCFPDEMRTTKRKEDDNRFIIINAMNEWAEGMALEPSDVYGRKFLETIRSTKLVVLKRGCGTNEN